MNLCLFGAPLDTDNLGVAALGQSVLAGIAERFASIDITLFDYGRGVRDAEFSIAGRRVPFRKVGAFPSRRLYASESLWSIRRGCRYDRTSNPAAHRILVADTVLDISGGDSFSDLYGMRRCRAMCLRKRIVIDSGIPLVLLPQTYGPFRSSKAHRMAQRSVRGATMAWARDARSFEILCDLLGPGHFDPARHRLGVDVAFALPANEPRHDRLPPPMRVWLVRNGDREKPLVGLNISGLIWHDPASARDRYGLQADYREAIVGLLVRLLRDSARPRVLLVPHVLTPEGHYESDPHACRLAMQAALDRHPDAAERIAIVPPDFDACEMKWIISRCNWFCGTRMHSTIAALSSGVPAAAIAYSDKTLGVFETCGQGEHVHDPRRLTANDLVERTLASFHQRDAAHAALAAALPCVIAKANEQMDVIATFIESLGQPRDPRVPEPTSQQA